MTKNLIMIVVIAMLTGIGSCSKDEGPQGPAGPQGAQGQPGQQGADGPAGVQGPAGNANVIVRNYTLEPSDFTEYGTAGQPQHRYSASISIPEVTSSVFNSGMVVVYYNPNGPSWFSLPQTLYESSYSYTLTYYHYVGGVGIQRYDSDLHSIPPTFTLSLKVVIVPPATGKKDWDVDWNNYSAVKEYFHIKE